MRLSSRAALLALAVSLAPACSAIVGAECADGYTRCGRMCVDLTSDPFNCGGCAMQCGRGLVCAASTCVSTRDAGVFDAGDTGVRDAGRIDGGVDAGLDARAIDADIDAASVDADLDAASMDAGSDDADLDGAITVCDLGELPCGITCVDPNGDPNHCGDCTTVCAATEVCSAGVCEPTCDPLVDCGGICVDLTSDPDHCGGCTIDCGSGICVDSRCEAALAGHLVIIGHDFERRRSAMSRLLANAVLLSGASPVRIVAWNAASTAAAIAGTNGGIDDGRGARTYTLRVAVAPEEVPVMLDAADSFLVYAQQNATDAELDALGVMWSTALGQFLDRGGVVVVLDAPSATNAGTHRILDAAGLFMATATSELVTPRLDTVAGRAGDPVLVGVPLSYRGEQHTVFYSTLDPDAIVSSASGPVVFDRTVTP
jgi:hypothetical protein